MYNVIKSPVVTEKSAMKNDKGVYTFAVIDSANKIEIKKAIKLMYGVDVATVRVMRVASKTRLGRKGRPMMKRHSYKKAMITLRDKQTIDINVFAKDKADKK